MGLPTDPKVRRADTDAARPAPPADPCAWCMGAGKYLERLDIEVGVAYLPVVCQGCGGDGARSAA